MMTPRNPELAEAQETINKQASLIAELRERIVKLEAELAEARKPGPPPGVKANRPRRPAGERKPRKKRSGD